MDQVTFDAMSQEQVATLAQEQRAKFIRLARAGLPFNPVNVEDIVGQNVIRLQNSMKMFGWTDPRFATAEQAAANGWTIGHDAVVVETKVRNPDTGLVADVGLINAKNLNGMPSLSAMLAMPDHELLTLQGIKPPAVEGEVAEEVMITPRREVKKDPGVDWFTAEIAPAAPAPFRAMSNHGFAPYGNDPSNPVGYFVEFANGIGQPEKVWSVDIEKSLKEGGIEVGDALALTLSGQAVVDIDAVQEDGSSIRSTVDRWAMWEDSKKVVLDKQRSSVSVDDEISEGPVSNLSGIGQRLAVIAPYWQDGLHNAKGIALAKELNQVIRERGLAEERDAIARLIAIHASAQRLGIQITSERLYLDDPDLRENKAEPASLQQGKLVRDKAGAYRPAAGGRPVLVDQGESVSLKTKEAEGYRAAMELAIAKGWTAIELSGKPAMLADAWLEAKLLGLDVVNYSPTKKDMERFGARLEAEQKKAVEQPGIVEQAPETVEIRPFVDAAGHAKTATVTYTVTQDGVPAAPFAEANGAAARDGTVADTFPAVTRTTTRVDGEVIQTDIDVGDDLGGEIDEEFNKARAEVNVEAKTEEIDAKASDAGRSRAYSGKVLAHGEAPYGHTPGEKMSYFVMLDTAVGDKEVWGVDLKRALEAGNATVGDNINLEFLGRMPVTVDSHKRDAEGHITGTEKIDTFRNEWSVQKIEQERGSLDADEAFELGTPDAKQLGAVLAFQAAHGDEWKDKLSASWGHGNYRGVDKSQAALLQQVRNHFGPEWLEGVKVEDLVMVEPVNEGQHIGPILAVKDGLVQQSIGRGATVWHAISSLDSPSPKVGDMADIRYAGGRGVIKGNEQGQGMDAGIGR